MMILGEKLDTCFYRLLKKENTFLTSVSVQLSSTFFCRKSKGPLTNVTGVTLVEYFRTFGPILTSRYKVNFWDTWLLKFDNFWGPFSDAWFLMHEHGDLKCHASKSFVTLKVSSFLGTHYSKKSHFVQKFNFFLPNITF